MHGFNIFPKKNRYSLTRNSLTRNSLTRNPLTRFTHPHLHKWRSPQ